MAEQYKGRMWVRQTRKEYRCMPRETMIDLMAWAKLTLREIHPDHRVYLIIEGYNPDSPHDTGWRILQILNRFQLEEKQSISNPAFQAFRTPIARDIDFSQLGD